MELRESELLNLISNTAGSIRQSLQALSVSLDLLSDRLDLADETVARQAASAMRSVFQLQRISVYLDLFRQFRGQSYTLNLQHDDVNAYLHQLFEKAADMLAGGGFRLLADLPSQPAVGCADLSLLELLVFELLGNAAANASDREVRATVRQPQPGLLVFTVQNRCDKDLPDQLFARYSAEPEALTDAVGLGLQVVSLGAQRHGGNLVLSRGPGQTVEAVMSIRLFEREQSNSMRLSSSPIRNVQLGYLALSTVMPWQLYDLKNLQ